MEKLLIYSVDKGAFLSKKREGMYQPYVWVDFDPDEVFFMFPTILEKLINAINNYDEMLHGIISMSLEIKLIMELFTGKYDNFHIPTIVIPIGNSLKDAIGVLMLIPMGENEIPIFSKGFKLIEMTSILDGQD